MIFITWVTFWRNIIIKITKDELKDIIRDCLEEQGVITEGAILNRASDHKKVVNDLNKEFKSYKKSTLKDRINDNIDLYNIKYMEKAESFLKSYFDYLDTNSILTKVTGDYHYYKKSYNALTSKGVYSFTIFSEYDDVWDRYVTSTKLSDIDLDKDIIKFIFDKNKYGFSLSFKGNTVKFDKTGINEKQDSKKYRNEFKEYITNELSKKGYKVVFSSSNISLKATITKK